MRLGYEVTFKGAKHKSDVTIFREVGRHYFNLNFVWKTLERITIKVPGTFSFVLEFQKLNDKQ